MFRLNTVSPNILGPQLKFVNLDSKVFAKISKLSIFFRLMKKKITSCPYPSFWAVRVPNSVMTPGWSPVSLFCVKMLIPQFIVHHEKQGIEKCFVY